MLKKMHMGPNKNSSLLNFIRKRVSAKKDKDAIIVMAGERGSTKSGCAITLGWLLDRANDGSPRFFLPKEMIPKEFKLKKGEWLPRLVFKPSDFMKLLSGKPKLPKGSVIIWDETGVEGDARDFQTKKNKLLKRTLETVRSRNLILILTAPTLQSYDVGFRRSNTLYIEAKGKTVNARGKPVGIVRVYRTSTNPRKGDVYYKYLRKRDETPVLKTIKQFYIGKPPAFLEAPYKRYKDLFQTKLYSSYLNELESADFLSEQKDREKNSGKNHFLLKGVFPNPWRFYDFDKKRFLLAPLKFELGLKDTDARQLKQYLEYKAGRKELTSYGLIEKNSKGQKVVVRPE